MYQGVLQAAVFYLFDQNLKIKGRELIKIQSMITLGCFKKSNLLNINSEMLGQMLSYYIQYFQKYDIDMIMISFSKFIKTVGSTIQPYATGIIQLMSQSLK